MKLVLHSVAYALWLIKEIFVAGFGLAAESFKPRTAYHPVIVRYPLRVTGAWEIFWFTSSITATPGTLSLGLREPIAEGLPRIVLVQAVMGSDPVAVMESLADMEEHLAPHVKDISFGVPGQEDTKELSEEFYEYPLDTLGRHMRAPDIARADDTPLPADQVEKTPLLPTALPGVPGWQRKEDKR